MTDGRLYRWSGPELELMEIVVSNEPVDSRFVELRSLRGFEDSVSCLLDQDVDVGKSGEGIRRIAA